VGRSAPGLGTYATCQNAETVVIEGTSTQWRAVRPNRLIWAPWDGDYSLFDGSTGDTHLLSGLPAEVLRQLSQGPMTGPQLTATLAQLCEVEETPDWTRKIAGILADLADLELIEPTTP
jgi:PqqD family protein of HPr-rel-A system